MDQQTVPSAQRRNFLLLMLGGVGAAIGAMTAWPILRFLSPNASGGGSTKVSLSKDQVPLGGAHFFDYQGRPAVILQPEPGQFLAMTAVCTHLGCVIKWVGDENEFLCPCHGGRFSTEGKVLGGPPPAPLETYPVALSGDELLVG